MEAVSSVSILPTSNFIISAENFEKNLKVKLKWNKQEWLASGEPNSRMHRLCNSMHFWKNKLKPALEDVSIIVTLYNRENNVRVDLLNIIEEIEKLDKTFKVVGVANFRNPRYVCLYFENKDIKDKVVKLFRMMNENYVIYLSWAFIDNAGFQKMSIHWLPLTINLDIIKQKLDKYVNIIEEEKKKIVFLSGREIPTAKIDLKVKFKQDITAEIIPHLMEINNMEALITISGRKPLCLNCDQLGHISRDCLLRFCSSCHSLKNKEHKCITKDNVLSYAATVKASTLREVLKDPDKFNDDAVINPIVEKIEDKGLIEKKIIMIQDQLKNVNSDVLYLEKIRHEKKRKVEEVQDSVQKDDTSSSDSANDEEDSSNKSMEVVELDQHSSLSNADLPNKNTSKAVNNSGELIKTVDRKTKIKKEKRKKANTTKQVTSLPSDKGREGEPKADKSSEVEVRSYGKPVYNNARRLKENLKFDRISDQREFIFED